MEIHVSQHGNDGNHGSMAEPVGTIGRAGQLAMPGDTVVVHEGIYREWVKPARGGLSNNRRIVYTAAAGEQVSIKGSEVAPSWSVVPPSIIFEHMSV